MENSQHDASSALPWGKSPRYQLDRRMRGPQSRSGRNGEENNLLPLPGIEAQPSSLQSVAISTEKYWLLPNNETVPFSDPKIVNLLNECEFLIRQTQFNYSNIKTW
jgi:hypothetical protein